MAGRIAIIDPDLNARMLLKAQLLGAYYRVETFGDPSAPDARAAAAAADLAFVDAGEAGRALFAHMRGPGGDAAVPIVLTGSGATPALLAEGADDILPGDAASSTPGPAALLLSRVRMLVARKHAREEFCLGGAIPARRVAPARPVAHLVDPTGLPCPPAAGAALAGAGIAEVQGGMAVGGRVPIVLWMCGGGRGEAGLRLIARLHEDPATRTAPLLAVCAEGDASRAAHAIDLGAGEAVCADCAPAELAGRLASLSRRAAEMDALRAGLALELRLARTDPLTGLGNRRLVEETLPRLLERARASGGGFALIVVDIDRFKRVNDRHGHACGDRVLAEVAARLRRAAGSRALVARLGGEEFLVALPVADGAEAAFRADCLRRAIAGRGVDLGSGAGVLSVTVSAGIALDHVDATAPALIAEADAALYRAKHAGRNCISLSGAAA